MTCQILFDKFLDVSAVLRACCASVHSFLVWVCLGKRLLGYPTSSRCVMPAVRHVRGVPCPRCAMSAVRHVRGAPCSRCAMFAVRHARWSPGKSVWVRGARFALNTVTEGRN
ncbi:hypothetical protein PAPYR_12715 [Paratrimastix pyriformis]|uniref:Uncharacterized protein n=1 Tax=Paratrimastix pyriformis TaxID=342808 RepID=A0ABQ8U1E9_9EUKA|nr:hypothetical protein PAPYR_12715 [Paratrimastix pyriformis]